MALRTYRPLTPGLRQRVTVSRAGLWSGKPEKGLVEGLTRKGGRNNYGRTCVFSKAGGHKRAYRRIDFKRDKWGVAAIVERFEYDPNRSAFIALVRYDDGEKRYILAPERLKVGDKVMAGPKADIKPGNALPIGRIPAGTLVHNIETKPGAGGRLVRAAGCSAQVSGQDNDYVIFRLGSGEQRRAHVDAMATIGVVSNSDHGNRVLGKAGYARHLGRKPSVRGVAMNPVDHPHGGGEGRSSGGRHPSTPWGKPTKGGRTRANKRTDKDILRSRHAGRRRG